MKAFYFFSVCFFGFMTTIYEAGPLNTGCLEKAKALALLETVEILLTKANASFPTCKDDVNTTDESECGWQKSLAYIDISKKLVSDVRKNFPACSKPDMKAKDCSEILANGHNESGIYKIWTHESFSTGKSIKVYCDMDTAGGGWTVIQRRGKFPVQQNFYQDWESYKNGFGNLSEEFWLGNENIRVLCQKGCKIRFDLVDNEGEKGFALYQNFSLSSDNYRLNISGYTGNIGDSMAGHANSIFSTKDKGDTGRVEDFKGGWWYYRDSYDSNLNGIYQPGIESHESVFWYYWRKRKNLSRVEMKVRPK